MPTWDPSYFQAIPWCAALLADPAYEVLPSRYGKPAEDTKGEFFTRTLSSDNTIKACIFQIRGPSNPTERPNTPPSLVSEVRAFLETDAGINGPPGIAHGGFVATIIDEVMGCLINTRSATTLGSPIMTAELTTKWRGPVPSGKVLMVRAWIEKRDGRKVFIKATVEAEGRQVLAEGYGVFIGPKSKGNVPEARKESKM